MSTDQLLAYLAGELAGAEHARIAAHVANCHTCADTAAIFRKAGQILRADAGIVVPPALSASARAIYRPLTAPVIIPLRPAMVPTRRLLPLRMVFAMLVVILLVVIGGGTQVLAASADALPGDALYAVKRASEEVRAALARDPGDEIIARLEIVRTRETELLRLQAIGRTDWMPETLAAGQAQLDRISPLLAQLSVTDMERASRLAGVADEAMGAHVEVLNRLLTTAPAQTLPGLQDAIERSTRALKDAKSWKRSAPGRPDDAGTTPAPSPTAIATSPIDVPLSTRTPPANSNPGPQTTHTPPGNNGNPPLTPPGQNNIPPQATRTPPGNNGNRPLTPPGQNNIPPQATRTPPGNNGNRPLTPPGQNNVPPQATRTPPGNNGPSSSGRP
ncbi:MAG: zf-HC2 domain-containing protein [Chloroflexi bacterium]|nr:zf-HC2 domain-containing protein [Chloroflexota bacterium]